MRTLEEFRDYFLSLPMSALRIIEHRAYEVVSATVVLREPPFQVELVISGKGGILPAHRHPHIDAYEVHISGDLLLVTGDTPEKADARLARRKGLPLPERKIRGHCFQVRNTDWHTATAGPNGASFWSIQHWSEGVPISAAGVDWEGPALKEKLG